MNIPRYKFRQTLSCTLAATALSMAHYSSLSCCESSKPATDTSTHTSPVGKGTLPYWTTRKSATLSPSATRTSLADYSRVVVIGAGMSGSSAAMHLAQEGVEVTLIDARGVADGATGRNGGFMCPPGVATLFPAATSGKGLTHLLQAAEILLFERDNRAALNAFIAARGIPCEIDRDVNVFQVFDSIEELRLKVGVLWPLRALSPLAGVDVLSGDGELGATLNLSPSSPWSCGLRIRKGMDTFCAADVAKKCVEDAVAAGADWLPETRALSLEEEDSGSGVIVHTETGSIRCDKVIVAINAYIPSLVPSLRKCITPIRNHVGVTSPVPPLAPGNTRCGISAEGGFVYLHQRPDRRVVVGGFRNQEDGMGVGVADDSVVVEHVAQSVREFVPTRFAVEGAGTEECVVEEVWTGVLGWSCDDLPWVGPVPNHPSVLVCGGFSGHGLTQTFLCGQAVAAMALGKKPPRFVDRFLPSTDRQSTADLTAGHTSL